ncbi:PQQ-binding-like beta-propeller repeat protein [Neorhodopirellula pilleata]|uniref:Outer membrane biogenesis protein BamB n=1 Tax=Neorhodopirellula pilleata TaxID=2714738 RepID=A0A5C6AHT6_9BACT|nr:PQQ-binding-like beta-propeller repeat protein [Neorhodopirellula pilleata]TWT98990.1 outer membrane biogenesis protein BamB [Neorhodopirellula pilleata]
MKPITVSHLAMILCLVTSSSLATSGCQKKTPVDEITVAESGIEVQPLTRPELQSQWPQWRGSTGDGVVALVDGTATESELAAPPTTWSESDNIRWRSPVPGRGHSSPIIVGDLVVMATANDADQRQSVVAYDRQTGATVWQSLIHEGGFPNPRDVHSKATNANGTIASDGNLFITAFLNDRRIVVTALDQSGQQVWQTDVGAFASRFGYAPSPLIYQSLVIIAADNGGGGYLAGLDLQSGKVAWRRDRGAFDSYSSPTVATVGGEDQLLITGGGRLASYDPATGTPIWETPCISDATCGTVVATKDSIFASGGYPDKETICLTARGERQWSNGTKIYEPSMITDGNHLFGVTDDGIAMCWSVADGDMKWKKRLGGNFSSSPILVGDSIYVSDLSGNTYVFRASGEEYQQVAKNQLGSDCYASPAYADGCLYYRIGLGEGEQRSEQLVCIAE